MGDRGIKRDLKQCPFCGGTPKIRMTYSTGSQSCPFRTYLIRCTKCGAERPGLANVDDAVRLWNRRSYNEVRAICESVYECGNFEEKVAISKMMDYLDRIEGCANAKEVSVDPD